MGITTWWSRYRRYRLNPILASILLLSLLAPQPCDARSKFQGFAELGGQQHRNAGIYAITRPTGTQTNPYTQQSYPNATVTIYNAGTLTLSTIFSDSAGTAKANPFTADINAYWFFFGDSATYDIKFSGGGITTPFTLSSYGGAEAAASAISVINVTDAPYSAPCDGVTDASAEIQSAIYAAHRTGATVFLPNCNDSPYLITTELHVLLAGDAIPGYPEITLGAKRIRLLGEGLTSGGAQTRGTTIKAGAAMRSVFANLSTHTELEGIRFDAAYLATYGIFMPELTGQFSSMSQYKNIHVMHALKDGIYSGGTTSPGNDAILFDHVWAVYNGVISATSGIRGQYQNGGVDNVWRTATVAGTVSTTTGVNTITGSGTTFTALGLRQGDFIRIGSTLATADYLQVETVNSDTLITTFSLSTATATVSGAQWAAFVGDGIHATGPHGVNGIWKVEGGLYRGNAAAGIFCNAFYGISIQNPQLETSGLWGLTLGTAHATQAIYSVNLIHPYMEGNQVANIWLGNVHNFHMTPGTIADSIKTAAGVTHRTWSNFSAGQTPQYTSVLHKDLDFDVIGNLAIDGYRLHNFVLVIAHTGAAIQHKFIADSLNTSSSPARASKIVQQSVAYSNTPTLDPTTAFVAGGGILTGGEKFLFNVANDQAFGVSGGFTDSWGVASVENNNTGAALMAQLIWSSDNVNGVTMYRPGIRLVDTAGTVQNILTSLTAGEVVWIRVLAGIR